MINRFSQFLVEEEKTVFFTFGRMNPPTIGHEMLLNKLAKAAGRNPYKVYLSKSNDPKKNPLSYNDKIKFARKMFPKHARQIIKDNKINNIMDIATKLYNEGYVNLVMAVDGPRSRQFDVLLNKYNGQKARHGFYNFKTIKFINVGERDASSEGIDGVSATKQRNAAKDNDFVKFSQGLPKQVSNKDSKALFNAVRKGMGLKEQKEFKHHVQLEPVSDLREAYVKDGIFEQGDEVVMLKHDIVGNIQHLGTNYVIVESKGETWRCWITDIEKTDPNTQPRWDNYDLPNDDNDGVVRESLNEAQKWKRGGPDGEIHTQHKGTTWRVRKDYNHNDRHVGEYRIEYKKKNPYGGHDWEWHDTVHGKEHAKSRLPESFKPHPEVVKAYKKTLDAEDQAADYNHRSNKARVTRAANHLSKKIAQHHPDLDMKGKIALRTKLQNMSEANQPEWGTPESTKKAKDMTPGEKNESLWANIHAKRARGEKMRKKGEKGAPTPDQIKRAQEGAMKRIATTQSNKADRMASTDKKGLETYKKREATTQDPDIKDREGTQPKRYHSGLSKATKVARDRHFKKHGKKADNDPSAYKPAPGDKNAKTRPSKYTTFVKRMMK